MGEKKIKKVKYLKSIRNQMRKYKISLTLKKKTTQFSILVQFILCIHTPNRSSPKLLQPEVSVKVSDFQHAASNSFTSPRFQNHVSSPKINLN